MSASLRTLLNKSAQLGVYKKKIIIGFVSIIGLVFYTFFVALPNSDENVKMKAAANLLEDQRSQIQMLTKQSAKLKSELAQGLELKKQASNRFHTEDEVEAFYRAMSEIALRHNLTVNELKRGVDTAILIPGVNAKDPPTPPAAETTVPPATPAPFRRIGLSMVVTGSFARSHAFLENLATFPKIINIEKLTIALLPEDRQSRVKLSIRMSTIHWRPAAATQSKPTVAPVSAATPAMQGSWATEGKEKSWMIRPASFTTNTRPRSASYDDGASELFKGAITLAQSTVRDPFMREGSSATATEPAQAPRRSTRPPLQSNDLGTYSLSGILIGPRGQAAIVKTELGESLLIKVGDILGNKNGKVHEITRDGLTVLEGKQTIRLTVQSSDIIPIKENDNVSKPAIAKP